MTLTDDQLLPVWELYLELLEGPAKAQVQDAIAKGDGTAVGVVLLKARNAAIRGAGLSCEVVTPGALEAAAARLSAARNPRFLSVVAKLNAALLVSMRSEPE